MRKPYSIARRLTASLLVTVTFVALFVAAAFYLNARSVSDEELERKADEMRDFLVSVLEIPLWELNMQAVQGIGEAFAHNDLVTSLSIQGHTAAILYASRKAREAAVIRRTSKIWHEDRLIGEIQFALTKQFAAQSHRTLLRLLILTTAWILLAVGLVTGVFIRVFLRRPLQRLNAIAQAYAAGDYRAGDASLPYLEFQPFENVLTRMGATIHAQVQALRLNERRYRKAQALGQVGNWEYNLQTTHFWGSDEARRIYGFDSALADFTTEEVEKCIPERARVHQALLDLIERGQEYDLEFEIHPLNAAEPRIIASVAELERDAHGQPLIVRGVIQDITARKRAEAQLQNHARLLEQAVQEKQREMETLFERLLRQEKLATIGQMAGSIAHELRNPLGAVKQSVFFLKRLAERQLLTPANPKVNEHLTLMETELDRSERVIADLLEMTRLKPLRCEQHEFRALLADALAHCQIPARIHPQLEFAAEPFLIWVDAAQFRQVLINLLTNAAQAITEEGQITIRVKQLTEKGGCVIELQDTGAGIAPDALAKVFDPLYTTKAAGTGLGLSICKQIIERHHGQIAISSQPGQGATVTLSLPDLPTPEENLVNNSRYAPLPNPSPNLGEGHSEVSPSP